MRLLPVPKKFLAASALLAAGIAAAAAQDTLPDGPGMQETVKACSGCHSVGTFRNVRRSPEVWDLTITNMIGWGMNLGGGDYDTVLNYLSTYLGTAPPPATPAQPAP